MGYRIVSTLSTMMGKANVNIQQLSDATKLSRTTISNLKNNRDIKGVDFNTLAVLCEFFEKRGFPCTPGDLLAVKK